MLTDIRHGHPIKTIRHQVEKDFGSLLSRAGQASQVERFTKRYEARMRGAHGTAAKNAVLDETLNEISKARLDFVRKSEADAVAAATSNDWNYPPTQGQQAAAATHALRVQGLAQATQRQLQTWGITDPNDRDADRAMAAVLAQLNLSMTSYEGEAGQETVHSNPQLAADLRRLGSAIWEMDMASDRQRDLVDEAMAAEAVSNFAGLINQGYTGQRRAMPDATNFSSAGGGSLSVGVNAPAPGGGGAVAGPTTDRNAASLAAAYAAGVAAGSNFAKSSRRGR